VLDPFFRPAVLANRAFQNAARASLRYRTSDLVWKLVSWSDATHELAWAAGFFDGEGSTGVSPARKVGSVRLFASVPQASSSPERLPSVLIRFHRAVAGLGHIGNPYLDPRSGTHIFQWRTDNLEEVQAVIALLWSELGPVKRSQANRALTSFAQQFRTRRFRRRRPKTARRLLLDRGRALRFRRRAPRVDIWSVRCRGVDGVAVAPQERRSVLRPALQGVAMRCEWDP